MRALPGTGLVLVHWTWFDHDALGSVFTLLDRDGELRWRLDWCPEVSGKDCRSPQSVLWQKLRLCGAILEVEAPGRFTLGHAAKLERVTFEARHIEGARGAFEVREIARSPFEEPQTGPTAFAPSERNEPMPLLRPQHLATIVLGEVPLLTPIHDVIEFGVDGRGRLGVICGDYIHRDFLLVEADGTILCTLELPRVPGGALFDMACVGGERWIVIAKPATAGVGISGYWVEPEAGRLAPIEGFDGTCAPELMGFDSEMNPWPCRISGSPSPQDPSNLSWLEALTVTSDGRVAVLSHFPNRVQFFSRAGQFLRAIELKEAWGREPRYPTGIRADLDGGVIVHALQGEPPIVRMDRDGVVDLRALELPSARRRARQLPPHARSWDSSAGSILPGRVPIGSRPVADQVPRSRRRAQEARRRPHVEGSTSPSVALGLAPCSIPWMAYPAADMRAIRRADPETERRWLEQVRAIATRILLPYDVDLYLFGSRARGDARVASDIDLGLDPKGEFPSSVLVRLEEEFDESTVPVEVDLVDLRGAGETLRAKARSEGIRWIASRSA